ncbi:phytanoyl-CoA dioxygenase family protein [Echinicola rosea]|uniref:Phytanoyl-CoA dioxygenase n=1 Tax=Echinicola rosea TaxID=1807691 RepID=A0ABQ1V5A7_9BACT|nr:phytanoyl-CoA dioxygenase family protein [Echinicola rosea]GGF39203.1 hypothetical protein GCM10011339_29690 [Echinicola rosea]
MAANKYALIRYITIDKCLKDRQRKWTLKDLIAACSEAICHFDGVDKGVSKRTIQMDLQHMRSEESGYNAPIVVSEKKFYSYEDPAFSITHIPLTAHDQAKLTELVETLKQYQDFTFFKRLSGLVEELENGIAAINNPEPSSTVLDRDKMQAAVTDEQPSSPLNRQRLTALDWKLHERGSYVFPQIYAQKEIKMITGLIVEHQKKTSSNRPSSLTKSLFQEIPELSRLIFNEHLTTILNAVDIDLFVTKVALIDSQSNLNVRWHQDTTIDVKHKAQLPGFADWRESAGYFKVCPPSQILKNGLIVRIHLEEAFEEKGAMEVFPGTHQEKKTNDQIQLMASKRLPTIVEVDAGGVHLMHPLLVHRSPKQSPKDKTKVIQLILHSLNLPNGLTWAEKHEIGIELR